MQQNGDNPTDESRYVPDQRTAILIAKGILVPVYGRQMMNSEEPFTASLEGNIWTVKEPCGLTFGKCRSQGSPNCAQFRS
jgi:hypothetical protein